MVSTKQIAIEIHETDAAVIKADTLVAECLRKHGETVRHQPRSTRQQIQKSAAKLAEARQAVTALRQCQTQLSTDLGNAHRSAQKARRELRRKYADDRMPEAIRKLRRAASHLLALGQLGNSPVDLCGQLSALDCADELLRMETEIESD